MTCIPYFKILLVSSCFPDSSSGKESLAMQETRFNSWVEKICWRRDRLPTPVFLGFPCCSAGKKSTCNAGDPGLTTESGRSPGEGIGYLLQYSRSLVGYHPRGHKESFTTEQLSLHFPYLLTLCDFSKAVPQMPWL